MKNKDLDITDYLRKIFSKIKLVLLIIDSDNNIIYYNKYFLKLLDLDKIIKKNNLENEIVKKLKLIDAINKKDKDLNLYNIFSNDKNYNNHILEIKLGKKFEKKLFFIINKIKFDYDSSIYKLILLNDITVIKTNEKFLQDKIKDLNKKLKYAEILASIDPLTKIYNRYKFYEECNKLINLYNRYGTIFSIIMFDIDNFKKINDNFGHITGDNVLKTISTVVSYTIRNTDIFFRWGGDEFIILLPNTNLEGAYISAEKIREVLENTDFNSEKEHVGKVTCSFGVSTIEKEVDCDELTKKIDSAMYKAKNSGKNRVFKI